MTRSRGGQKRSLLAYWNLGGHVDRHLARVLEKTPPVSFHQIERYADDDYAGREMALLEGRKSRQPRLSLG